MNCKCDEAGDYSKCLVHGLNENLQAAEAWARSADITTPFNVTNQERLFAKILESEVRRLRDCLARHEPYSGPHNQFDGNGRERHHG